MTALKTRPHPLDFKALQKGTYIETEALERATRCSAEDQIRFKLRVLELRTMIEQQTSILSRMEGIRLRLMDDDEALFWNLQQAQRAFASVDRAAYRTTLIDTSKLTDDQQQIADVAARAICSTAMAMNQEKAKHARALALLAVPPPRLIDDD